MAVVERFLTVEQIAAELHLHIETVRRYLRSGELKGFQISRQAGWLVARDDLEQFIAERRAA
jgi:excisionase family DNA binding protein